MRHEVARRRAEVRGQSQKAPHDHGTVAKHAAGRPRKLTRVSRLSLQPLSPLPATLSQPKPSHCCYCRYLLRHMGRNCSTRACVTQGQQITQRETGQMTLDLPRPNTKNNRLGSQKKRKTLRRRSFIRPKGPHTDDRPDTALRRVSRCGTQCRACSRPAGIVALTTRERECDSTNNANKTRKTCEPQQPAASTEGCVPLTRPPINNPPSC